MNLNASKMNQSLKMADQSSQYTLPFSANLILQSSIGKMNYGLCFVLPWNSRNGPLPERTIRLNGQLMWFPVPTPVEFSQKAKVTQTKHLM